MRRREFIGRTASTTLGITIAGAIPGRVFADEDRWRVLDESVADGPPELMLNRYLMDQVAQAERRAEAVAETIDDEETLRAWQETTRGRFVEALGGFPQRTPLHTQVVGTVQGDGYRVVKILLESQPKHYLSGALFLPDDEAFEPPYPGILVPCGHSEKPRERGLYQRPCVIAARNGMASFVYDPVEQGERMQRLDAEGHYDEFGTRGHNRIGVSAKLLGWNAARSMVWDGIRGLDFLSARDEIDGARLGCMGISGGGTLTSYLMAIDPRIAAAVPTCYLTTLREVYAAIGPQDAEQTIHGQLAFGMDHAEYLTLFAPRPVRLCATTRDFFPIAGAKQAYARARGVYRRLGIEDRISFFEDDNTHTWSEPLRVAAVQWLNRWLRDSREMYVPPIEDMGISAEEMRVTEDAQVMRIPGAKSAYDLMRDGLDQIVRQRTSSGGEALRDAVRRRAGIRMADEIPRPEVGRHGESETPTGQVRKLTFAFRPGVRLPALDWVPREPTGQPLLIAHGEGKSASVDLAEAAAGEGRRVLAVDLSGFGETQGTESRFYRSTAEDASDALIADALSRSLVGMRAEDLIGFARWLAAETESGAVELHAVSWAVTPALHAAVAEPELFSAVTIDTPPRAWEQVVRNAERHRFSDVVHGGLIDYSLADLKAAVSG